MVSKKAVDERNEWLGWFATEPLLDPIRDDSRYLEILRATNNPVALDHDKPDTGSSRTAERERSIAVLPFRVIKGAGPAATQDDYLSIGLADSVTMRLSNVRKFIVRPTSSVLRFAERDTDPFNSGQELGVEYVVDGIIRHIGDRIRVSAQLLDVNENAVRWSASFSEQLCDVLEMEDSIAEQVTRNLLPHLTGDEQAGIAKRGTENREAHDAYLQGRYFWNQFTPDSSLDPSPRSAAPSN